MAVDVQQRYAALERKQGADAYNYRHFLVTHVLADARRIITGTGIQPGEEDPDFKLSRAGGGTLRLSELRDKPVLLRFGSYR